MWRPYSASRGASKQVSTKPHFSSITCGTDRKTYEKYLRISIQSTREHLQRCVKTWFLFWNLNPKLRLLNKSDGALVCGKHHANRPRGLGFSWVNGPALRRRNTALTLNLTSTYMWANMWCVAKKRSQIILKT